MGKRNTGRRRKKGLRGAKSEGRRLSYAGPRVSRKILHWIWGLVDVEGTFSNFTITPKVLAAGQKHNIGVIQKS